MMMLDLALFGALFYLFRRSKSITNCLLRHASYVLNFIFASFIHGPIQQAKQLGRHNRIAYQSGTQSQPNTGVTLPGYKQALSPPSPPIPENYQNILPTATAKTSFIPQKKINNNAFRPKKKGEESNIRITLGGYDVSIPYPHGFAHVKLSSVNIATQFSDGKMIACVFENSMELSKDEFHDLVRSTRKSNEAAFVPDATEMFEEYSSDKVLIFSFKSDARLAPGKRSFGAFVFLDAIVISTGITASQGSTATDMEAVGIMLNWCNAIIKCNSVLKKTRVRIHESIVLNNTEIHIPNPMHFRSSPESTYPKNTLLNYVLQHGCTDDPIAFSFTHYNISSNPGLPENMCDAEYESLVTSLNRSLPATWDIPFASTKREFPQNTASLPFHSSIHLMRKEVISERAKGLTFYFGTVKGRSEELELEYELGLNFCMGTIHVKNTVLMLRISDAFSKNDVESFSREVIVWRDAIIAANE